MGLWPSAGSRWFRGDLAPPQLCGAPVSWGEIALPHCRQRFACAWEAAGRPCRSAEAFMRIRPRCPLFGGASPLQQVFSAAGLTLVRGRIALGVKALPCGPLPSPALPSQPGPAAAGPGQVQWPRGWGSGLRLQGTWWPASPSSPLSVLSCDS